jgi:hypothetical protein
MFNSYGTLHYELNDRVTPPYKLILSIDQGISDYYFATIPKSIRARKQMHKAHISVVRKELPLNLDVWGKHKGRLVAFDYEPLVRQDNVYLWIDCYSMVLEQIRTELGLHNAPLYPATYHTPMPTGTLFTKRFHCTIANTKELK